MDKKKRVKRIFDAISHRYDFLNHFLSLGVDYYWRWRALKLTKISKNTRLLDIACGTGDFSIEAKRQGVEFIIGADLSFNMLNLFNQKKEWSKGNIIQCVAENLPINDNSFTNITVAFGVRNFYDIQKGFESFNRVLDTKGKVTILEFSLPKKKLVKGLYLFYFNNILPFIGKLISKDKEAYTYLPESVGEFDKKIDLVKLLINSGFKKVDQHYLTFGLVQVVIAEK